MISNTAKICKGAVLGENVSIGDYTFIGPNVKIGNNVSIGNNAIIEGNVHIGNNNQISHYVIIGTPPQDKKYDNEPNYIYIGNNNVISEFVTIHLPTNDNKISYEEALSTKEGITYVGNNNFIMISSHIAHNCILHNNIIFANSVALAGHCIIYNNANIGAYVMIHQFTQIGEFCMIGSGFRVSKDVIPYTLAGGYDFKIIKINSIGLKRNGFSPEAIASIKNIVKTLLWSNHNVSQGIEIIKQNADNQYAKRIVEFILNSKRGITR
jgi:UDP-N-acetylglucosamine acyltransferase